MFWAILVAVGFILGLYILGLIAADHVAIFLLVAAAAVAIGLKRFLRGALAVTSLVIFVAVYGYEAPLETTALMLAVAMAVYGIAIMIRGITGGGK